MTDSITSTRFQAYVDVLLVQRSASNEASGVVAVRVLFLLLTCCQRTEPFLHTGKVTRNDFGNALMKEVIEVGSLVESKRTYTVDLVGDRVGIHLAFKPVFQLTFIAFRCGFASGIVVHPFGQARQLILKVTSTVTQRLTTVSHTQPSQGFLDPVLHHVCQCTGG